MNPYKKYSFLKLVIRFGIIFLVVITLLKIIVAIFQNEGISGMIEQYFSKDTWQQFAKMQLGLSLLYGAFMAGYYKFIKK